MNLSKECAKELQGDFIPGGKLIDIRELSFRLTEKDEVYRCCRQITDDLQSGPIFCGKIAEYVAKIKDEKGNITGVVALCKRHAPPREQII